MATLKFNPFLSHINNFNALISKAEETGDFAKYLYLNNARKHLFMLEALTRLFAKIVKDKKMLKWSERFKKLEDALGEIDYYDAFSVEFSGNKNVPIQFIAYLNLKRDKCIEKLNKQLHKKDWDTNRLQKFADYILELNLNFDESFINAIKIAIDKELKEALDFAKLKKYKYTTLEEEVHELRRKLRWISIYAQSLNGIVQLTDYKKSSAAYKKYLTPSVLKSPYNVLPKATKGIKTINFDKTEFYCLSWIVNELGTYKDNGFRIEILETLAAQELLPLKEVNLDLILPKNQLTVPEILKEVSAKCQVFFEKDKTLQKLIA